MNVDINITREQSDKGLAYKNVEEHEKTRAWLDQSFAWVCPTRGMVDLRVPLSWMELDFPMNTARTPILSVRGMEVAEAYNYLFSMCIEEEACTKVNHPAYAELILGTRFILTTEDDNTLPTHAVTTLLGAIYTCPDCGGTPSGEEWVCENGHRGYDAVSGLYFTKSVPPRPMAYGDPANGPDDMRPRSVKAAMESKSVIEVNGIAMGCAVWRKDMVRKVSKPWFKTTPKNNDEGVGGGTQDLYFCGKAKEELGARFGVHCGVRCGHINTRTSEVF